MLLVSIHIDFGSSQRTFREKLGVNIHENLLNGCLYPGWGVWEERVSVSQQRRWEEGKWAMRRKPEGEWWSVKRYTATFPDPPVGPLCYLDKMGGIKWPAVPLGWVADPLAREESQPLLPSSLQWERLFWFLSSLSHRQTWEAQFIWDRVRGNRAPCHLNTRTLSRQRFVDSLCQCLPWL